MDNNMDSNLNPEAREFRPLNVEVLTRTYTVGFQSLVQSVSKSKELPVNDVYVKCSTFTLFNGQAAHATNVLREQANRILNVELPVARLKPNDNIYNTEKIIEANDSILERVYINLDRVTKVDGRGDQLVHVMRPCAEASIKVVQFDGCSLISDNNMPRPQFNFKDTIDNSSKIFVPKIKDKPNNIAPLSMKIIYDNNGIATRYEHPYLMELDSFYPLEEFVNPDNESLIFPPPTRETMLTFVETEAQVDDLLYHLTTVKQIAIDLEHHSYRTYQGITCLMQITTVEGGDFIIDALAVREHLQKLNLVFTNPKILKVLHGADMDVLWLQRDFGLYIVGLFDTHKAAITLKMPGHSLKNLLRRYCQIDIDKKYQLADWRIRPLPKELVEYARLDTHYLLYIYRKMKAELLAMASGKTNLVMAVFEHSRQICRKTYSSQVADDFSHLDLYYKSRKCFNTQQMSALKMLYIWRDENARQLDESTGYLIPNHMLIKLAESLPRGIQEMGAFCNPMPPFVAQNLVTIHRMLLSCRELPTEPQLEETRMGSSLQQPLRFYDEIHDFTEYNSRDDRIISVDESEASLNVDFVKPEVIVFNTSNCTGATLPEYKPTPCVKASMSNVNAQLFIPPYQRRQYYRSLSMIQEMREFKEKATRIAAISKGDKYIKKEVLLKLEAKSNLEEQSDQVSEKISSENTRNNTAQKKRKMTIEKAVPIVKPSVSEMIRMNGKLTQNQTKYDGMNGVQNSQKQHIYNGANYKKFFKHSQEPKKKFRK